LLREQGEQQRIGIADRILGQTQSSSYWKLSVDKMRNVGRYSSVRTNVEIETDPRSPHAKVLSPSSAIKVTVESQGIHACYNLESEPEKSWRTIGRVGANAGDIEDDTWESIAELDNTFFNWLELELARQP